MKKHLNKTAGQVGEIDSVYKNHCWFFVVGSGYTRVALSDLVANNLLNRLLYPTGEKLKSLECTRGEYEAFCYGAIKWSSIITVSHVIFIAIEHVFSIFLNNL